MSYKGSEDQEDLTETEYIPTDYEEDLHQQYEKLHRKLESVYREEGKC